MSWSCGQAERSCGCSWAGQRVRSERADSALVSARPPHLPVLFQMKLAGCPVQAAVTRCPQPAWTRSQAMASSALPQSRSSPSPLPPACCTSVPHTMPVPCTPAVQKAQVMWQRGCQRSAFLPEGVCQRTTAAGPGRLLNPLTGAWAPTWVPLPTPGSSARPEAGACTLSCAPARTLLAPLPAPEPPAAAPLPAPRGCSRPLVHDRLPGTGTPGRPCWASPLLPRRGRSAAGPARLPAATPGHGGAAAAGAAGGRAP